MKNPKCSHTVAKQLTQERLVVESILFTRSELLCPVYQALLMVPHQK